MRQRVLIEEAGLERQRTPTGLVWWWKERPPAGLDADLGGGPAVMSQEDASYRLSLVRQRTLNH